MKLLIKKINPKQIEQKKKKKKTAQETKIRLEREKCYGFDTITNFEQMTKCLSREDPSN